MRAPLALPAKSHSLCYICPPASLCTIPLARWECGEVTTASPAIGIQRNDEK